MNRYSTITFTTSIDDNLIALNNVIDGSDKVEQFSEEMYNVCQLFKLQLVRRVQYCICRNGVSCWDREYHQPR